ncbi:MAG TPA: voltage-gated potassium channel protein [Castellaniella sp.]|uniref:voltage-gated potassium channel protein n=1 Tax=Castellaniella sp. TaxID=1955812 RepID=UPI002EE9BBCC
MRIRWSSGLARLWRFLPTLPWHWLFAILVSVDGYLFLDPALQTLRGHGILETLRALDGEHIASFVQTGGIPEISRLMLGIGVQVMAVGLFMRARLAWAMSLLLLAIVSTFSLWRGQGHVGLLVYTVVLVALLVAYWRHFDRSSLTAGSLFAVISVGSLLVYAVFGVMYLGDEFTPPVKDPITAFYFAIVSMSTVGYGDITPHTATARLFTASIIIMGITVFATSIGAIAGPLIGGNLRRLMRARISHAMRKNHIIIAGVSPLAQSVYAALRQRGHEVTVIVPTDDTTPYPADADVLVGDASDADVLRRAGAGQARYVLALRLDDSENAFIVMAGREVAGTDTKLVALANSSVHLAKIRRVNPDIVISPQMLGSEILARTLSGEPIDEALITQLLFGEKTPESAA